MNCPNSGSRAGTGTIVRELEVLRQPLEDKLVTISRAQGSLTFPANFQLVGATPGKPICEAKCLLIFPLYYYILMVLACSGNYTCPEGGLTVPE